MIPQADSKAKRERRRLEVARVIIGAAVIVTMLAVILCGVVAFTEQRDAWLAMKLPLYLTAILIWGFARIAKAIVSLEVSRHR